MQRALYILSCILRVWGASARLKSPSLLLTGLCKALNLSLSLSLSLFRMPLSTFNPHKRDCCTYSCADGWGNCTKSEVARVNGFGLLLVAPPVVAVQCLITATLLLALSHSLSLSHSCLVEVRRIRNKHAHGAGQPEHVTCTSLRFLSASEITALALRSNAMFTPTSQPWVQIYPCKFAALPWIHPAPPLSA